MAERKQQLDTRTVISETEKIIESGRVANRALSAKLGALLIKHEERKPVVTTLPPQVNHPEKRQLL